jgi:hypothetical protein
MKAFSSLDALSIELPAAALLRVVAQGSSL